jgi:hypothetical protein
MQNENANADSYFALNILLFTFRLLLSGLSASA